MHAWGLRSANDNGSSISAKRLWTIVLLTLYRPRAAKFMALTRLSHFINDNCCCSNRCRLSCSYSRDYSRHALGREVPPKIAKSHPKILNTFRLYTETTLGLFCRPKQHSRNCTSVNFTGKAKNVFWFLLSSTVSVFAPNSFVLLQSYK